jgi:acetyl esterase/lipase
VPALDPATAGGGRRLLVALAVVLLAVLTPGTAVAQASPLPQRGPFVYGTAAEEEWVTVFPQPAHADAPAVILVHGGAFSEQPSMTELASTALSLQKQGFAIFTIDYPQVRHRDEQAFPRVPAAVERAVHWTQEHAVSYGADPANVEMDSFSSGGLLAGIVTEHMDRKVPGTIRALVSHSGTTDLKSMVQLAERGEVEPKHGRTMERILDCSPLSACDEGFALEWSPVAHVDPATCVPWLIGSYEHDTVPLSQQQEMVSASEAAGCPIELIVVPGKGHEPGLSGEGPAFLSAH